MNEESQLDIEALVAPISPENPCGSNYDERNDDALVPLFSELNSLANLARSYEKTRYQNLITNIRGAGGVDPPQWLRVRELAIQILSKYTKDTRALIALVEAQGHLYGLDGLTAAFAAASAIVTQYGLTLYPTDEGEEPYYCIEKLGQLCSSEAYHLQSAIYDASIFEYQPGYSWFGYTASERLQKKLSTATDEKERDRLIQESPMTMENFLLRLNDVNDRRVFDSFDKLITSALTEARKLDDIAARLCKHKVGIRRIVEDLDKLQKWYADLIAPFWKKLPEPSTDAVAIQGDGKSGSDAQATSPQGTNAGSQRVDTAVAMASAVANREQALSSLLQVANFFRTTEPHSPVSYALEQTVRWGKMPLPELLKELVAEESLLSGLFSRIGIQEKEDK